MKNAKNVRCGRLNQGLSQAQAEISKKGKAVFDFGVGLDRPRATALSGSLRVCSPTVHADVSTGRLACTVLDAADLSLSHSLSLHCVQRQKLAERPCTTLC